jgi:3-deoxy-alpha-D-manno-octulosonate 8-oxidase
LDIRIFKQVPRLIFGRGSYSKFPEILSEYRNGGYIVFVVDHVHEKNGFLKSVPSEENDLVFAVETSSHEPTTDQVDGLRDQILDSKESQTPSFIVGIGGGSAMDISKAVSVVLTNAGSSRLYQGWDLVKNESIPKMAIPTLSGTGAEASRTAVLTSEDKKYGINSDKSMFNLVMMDPDLIESVPSDQRFYTGMDSYIHSVESIEGSFINTFGTAYAKESLELCEKVFLGQGGTNDDLMVASYLGGASVANSEVGVAHAMSYGLSLVLGFRHGIANCIAFRQLEEFYPKYVPVFMEMLELNGIVLPERVTEGISDGQLSAMIKMTHKMERPLKSALGDNWKEVLDESKIKDLYLKM